jgi:UDP-glucuronate 4-epimerase
MKVLVTGAAGFIGMHTSKRLLDEGYEVVGLDNMNNYYDPKLKEYRLNQLVPYEKFRFIKMDLCDREGVAKLFSEEKFERVIHLAAQAGVRYSIEKPFEYTDSNITGFMTILEGCRHNNVEHLLYASSSSVYGMNKKVPFSEEDRVDNPVSLYAATKKANELMAHSYSHLYKIPTTGLRFFTVYGPAGRPDMAPWLFTEAIVNDKPIKVFNNGQMQRDFTYIDDIVEGIYRIQKHDLKNMCLSNIFNIGNNEVVKLEHFIKTIEKVTGKVAEKIMMDMQLGDVKKTYADIDRLNQIIGYKAHTSIEKGLQNFYEWYEDYHFMHN